MWLFATVAAVGVLSTVHRIRLPNGFGRMLSWYMRPLYGWRRIGAFTVGYCTVFLSRWPSGDLVVHELEHQNQCGRCMPKGQWIWNWYRTASLIGLLRFMVRYNLEYLRHGYYNNRYEVEARKVAGQG